MLSLLYWPVVALGLAMGAGTLLSFSRHPHWFVRGWDFPRPLIAGLALLSGSTYGLVFQNGQWWDWGFLGIIGLCVGWQSYRIYPYTPAAATPVKTADRVESASRFRLVASNVQRDNNQHERWLEVIRRADPDVILAVEVDEDWAQVLDTLRDDYPHFVRQPQDNFYGMMLLSRLELIDPQVRFIVQDDVPSIHTEVVLESGQRIDFRGVHPRPPEPINGQHATARDAEVVLLGREIDERTAHQPTVVAGDFNDVAWSYTTDLFVQISGLLDPRQGRGLYNTFHAERPWFRFPLDHVFHSNDFRLVDLRVLEYVGSDHFPVCVDLSYEPAASGDQPEPEASAEEEAVAEEKVAHAAQQEENGELNGSE